MNVLVIVSDTFRWDYIGAYGNDWIKTPNLDQLAAESVIYEAAFAEGLPTVPARRVIFTGRPIFPWELRPAKGDPLVMYGWHSLYEEDVAMAEHLRDADYVSALFNDCYHLMKPTRNFHRGFDVWRWTRGQEGDPLLEPDLEQVKDLVEEALPLTKLRPRSWIIQHLMNRKDWTGEEDTYVAKTMACAADWLKSYKMPNPFYIHVEVFDPHEPWDPPTEYGRMYKDDYPEDCLQGVAPPLTGKEMKPGQAENVKAAYAGKCTLVDRWIGHLLDTLRETGHMDDTLVVCRTSSTNGTTGSATRSRKCRC